MVLTDSRRGRVIQLVLQIARDTVAQTHLKTLLTVANATIAGHRQEPRMAKARIRSADTSSKSKKRQQIPRGVRTVRF
jgi:hypothetical protein